MEEREASLPYSQLPNRVTRRVFCSDTKGIQVVGGDAERCTPVFRAGQENYGWVGL